MCLLVLVCDSGMNLRIVTPLRLIRSTLFSQHDNFALKLLVGDSASPLPCFNILFKMSDSTTKQKVLDELPFAVCSFSSPQQCVFANKAAGKLLQSYFVDIVPHLGKTAYSLEITQQGTATVFIELNCTWLECKLIPNDTPGTGAERAISLTDITTRRVESELREFRSRYTEFLSTVDSNKDFRLQLTDFCVLCNRSIACWTGLLPSSVILHIFFI
jgi:hypothetical protein